MRGWRKWRTVGLLALALGIVLAGAWGWLGLGSPWAREEAYQQRLARWGGWSRALPSESHPPARYRDPICKYLGSRVYLALIESPNRVAGNGGRPGSTADWAGATPAQLAELLERQPIRTAQLSGSKHLGDDWLAGLKEPERCSR